MQLANLEATATSFRDKNVPFGEHSYELRGQKGEATSLTVTCGAVVGPGQVLSRLEFDSGLATDLTVGLDGLMWIMNAWDLTILRYDPDTGTFGEAIPLPIERTPQRFSWPARIACDRENGLVYILDQFDDSLFTFDGSMTHVNDPVKLVLTDDEEARIYIASLVFSPTGNNDQGSLLLVEGNEATIYEISRQGEVLRSFRHPDWHRDPPREANAPFGPFVFGLAWPPEGGDAFLDLSGGTMWDRRTTRLLRVSAFDGEPTGYEIPLAGLDLRAEDTSDNHVNILWHGDRLFALNAFELAGVLYELRA
ncbi:MAG: NHL repeat-containing protein, partial [Planctomycetota bacterium]